MDTSWTTGEQEGKATFIVEVLFRQNDTWQGSIRWMDQKKIQCFRSTLEMIRLMDEALGGPSESQPWEQDG